MSEQKGTNWGPAAVSAASGLFGFLGQRRQYKYNKRLMEKKFGMDKQMFDYQNAYNTPLNQMKRLEEAGLNPALMYGQGTTGNASDYPKMEAIPTDMSATQIAHSAAAGAQISVMNSQKKLNEANALKSSIEGSVKAGEFGIAKEMSRYQMSKLSAETTEIDSRRSLNIQTLEHQAKTGMLKGDILGNIAKAFDININQSEGKKEFKEKLYLLLGSQAILKLAPSLIQLLGRYGFTKGMSQGQFDKQADKWLNKPSKLD